MENIGDDSNPDTPYRKGLRRREDGSGAGHGWRFVTFSCDHRRPLLVSLPVSSGFEMRSTNAVKFVQTLAASRTRLGFRLYAFVVMPEHVHLLVEPKAAQDWATIASAIKIPVARFGLKNVPRLSGSAESRVGETTEHGFRKAESRGTADKTERRFWQPGGGFDRNVRDLTEFTKAIRYIHRNPVERELVATPQEWPWSSVRWWMNERGKDEVVCDPPPGKIDWRNWKGYL